MSSLKGARFIKIRLSDLDDLATWEDIKNLAKATSRTPAEVVLKALNNYLVKTEEEDHAREVYLRKIQ